MSSNAALARRLGTVDAVAIGLASMIGAGVFAVFAPAAAAAGDGLLVALAIAALVAFCNATSSAQLAARYPESGGTYVYGRERLGDWWGYLAGWSFVVGKTASCAAMAITFAAYTVPTEWQKPVAAAAVVVLGAVSALGVTRTARLARILVTAVLVILVAAVVAGLAAGPAADVAPLGFENGPYGVLQAAGLLFFAFAGYARIATLGEEVRDPERTIPRAIVVSFAAVVALYLVVSLALLSTLGATALAGSRAPIADLVAASPWPWLVPFVGVGASLGALGALLALLAGVSRTALAMGRRGDLPRALTRVSATRSTPIVAELTLTAVLVVLVLVTDLRAAIGFSSFGVLLYYFVANVAAFGQPRSERRYPRVLTAVGAVGCVVLAVSVPLPSLIAGAAVVAAGVLIRMVVLAVRRRGRAAR